MIRFVVLMLVTVVAHAATVPLPATGVTLICAEGCTVTATTATTAPAYYFGAGTTYFLVPSLKLPALISCVSATAPACTNLGGDPISGTAKSLYAVQQSTAYTVSWKNAAGVAQTPIIVPALMPNYVVSCSNTIPYPPPTTFTLACTAKAQ
jgi:hypothetical protein